MVIIKQNMFEQMMQGLNANDLHPLGPRQNKLLAFIPPANELQSLNYIALLTPWVGGKAVYSARILLGIDPDRHGIAYRLQKDKDENEQNKIIIYPIPTQDAITIEFVNMPNTQINISVFDIIGKKVLENNFIATKKVNLNLNSLKSGTYLIRISDFNGLIETKLLIIN